MTIALCHMSHPWILIIRGKVIGNGQSNYDYIILIIAMTRISWLMLYIIYLWFVWIDECEFMRYWDDEALVALIDDDSKVKWCNPCSRFWRNWVVGLWEHYVVVLFEELVLRNYFSLGNSRFKTMLCIWSTKSFFFNLRNIEKQIII
jgi:hypothetical protein